MKKKTRVDTDPTLLIMKKFSDPIVMILAKTPLTANQISIGSFLLFAPFTSFLLITGTQTSNLIALAVLILHSFLDLMDGELARQKKIVSRLGGWFESSLDPMMQHIVLISIAINVVCFTDSSVKYLAFLAILGQSVASILGGVLTNKFKIDPLTGNGEFNELVGTSKNSLDFLMKNIMVPSHPTFIFLFTMRFYLIVGILSNRLPLLFALFAIGITVRSVLLYFIITAHFSDNPKLQKYAVFKYLRSVEQPSS